VREPANALGFAPAFAPDQLAPITKDPWKIREKSVFTKRAQFAPAEFAAIWFAAIR
jgi:hypothetical protein